MRQFPLFFNMDHATVAVFGSGEEAIRKVRLLAKTDARIEVLSAGTFGNEWGEFGNRVSQRSLENIESVLETVAFAIIAMGDEAVENGDVQGIYDTVKAAGVPVNVVDAPELCDFTVPSMLERGDLVAAIGTAGSAPVLARQVRAKLETMLPQSTRELVDMAREARPRVKDAIPDFKIRRDFWDAFYSGAPAEAAFAGDMDKAAEAMDALMDRFAADVPSEATGEVYLVGGGPGDPELLTVKALRILQTADVVYYDRLVGAGVIDLIRRDADRICVGKSRADHSVPQPKIHELLVQSAKEGKRVVRLKGGDPFVFGRGGEEAEAVRAHGITVHIVPGISSALGCAASAQVPLTHRDHAQALTFVTGHAKEGKLPDVDWPVLARANHTLVVFMGVNSSATIEKRLIADGRDPATPIAIIENGTGTEERQVFGSLGNLSRLIDEEGISSPALLIIGEVAGLSALAKEGV